MRYTTMQIKADQNISLTEYIPLLLGLCALYIPTFANFSQTLWQTDEEGHGPLILAAVIWMFYELAQSLSGPRNQAPKTGIITLTTGLIAYVIGRSQSIAILEVASIIPTTAGGLAALSGWNTASHFRFPLFFTIFMAPVPGFIIDALTGPLKLFISSQAESILYSFGYPVARMGVSLSVGQYQLLVADACSGLNSMVSLIAVGLFFMHLVKRTNIAHNILLFISIPFIAIAANLIRVIAICLVTYYYGDEVGQGFVHGATGVLLFGVSLTLMFLLDAVLAVFFAKKKAQA